MLPLMSVFYNKCIPTQEPDLRSGSAVNPIWTGETGQPVCPETKV